MVYRAMILAAESAVNFVSPQMSTIIWRFKLRSVRELASPRLA